VTVPIVSRLSGLVQADFSSDWWSVIAKLSFAFDPSPWESTPDLAQAMSPPRTAPRIIGPT
jgi:hypothetical protein